MKRLFVCKANIARSQAAMEFYRLRGGDTDSAGTAVDTPGATLGIRPGAKNTLEVMREDFAIDMSSNTRTQLTEAYAKSFDSIIIMAQAETIPDWALTDTRVTRWDINDPKSMDITTTRTILHEIKDRVDALPL